MTSIFESKKYPTLMYLAILIVSLLIVFSILDFIERTENPNLDRIGKISLTAMNILEEEPEITGADLYSNKSYIIYYSVIAGLLTLIAVIIISLILTMKRRINQ